MKTKFKYLLNRAAEFWTAGMDKRIMTVEYNLLTDQISCTDWYGMRQSYFSGKFSLELWTKIKPHCLIGTWPHTKIYIWAGITSKHLAYNEPIENYIENPYLLKTGQGFDFHSRIRYGESSKRKCPTCNQAYP